MVRGKEQTKTFERFRVSSGVLLKTFNERDSPITQLDPPLKEIKTVKDAMNGNIIYIKD